MRCEECFKKLNQQSFKIPLINKNRTSIDFDNTFICKGCWNRYFSTYKNKVSEFTKLRLYL